MDALNRHLKSETGVECARIVERGKGSGGGVLGELDSGLATDWCRYFVWGDIVINANLTRLREREKIFSFSFS